MSKQESGGLQTILNTANLISASSKRVRKNKNFKTAFLSVLVKSVLAMMVAYLLYSRFSDGNVVIKYIILTLTNLFIVWTISSYSKGQWEDHVVTTILFMFIGFIYYVSWTSINYLIGLDFNNPVTIGYFSILTFLSAIIIVSRYTYLNIVKAIGWAIGLATVGLFAFTYSVWGTLKLCDIEKSEDGIQDPMKIVIPIYLLWIAMIGLTFVAEMTHWSSTKHYLFIGAAVIGMVLLGYTVKRCETAKQKMKNSNEAENIEISDEPSWVNNGAHISTFMAWFNLFIGHYISSAFFAFVGYYTLNQCASKDDPRVMSVNFLSLIYLVIGFIYGVKRLVSS